MAEGKGVHNVVVDDAEVEGDTVTIRHAELAEAVRRAKQAKVAERLEAVDLRMMSCHHPASVVQ
jgi:hypothetical protein